ncbi:MAG: CPXCG motif-containing cysteine-rich protein [Gammaproteobacteria bacterium]|nr:CPXCG motif-containing cysteine-rich protein [Gammaproteobacteria bacterium]
MNAIEPVAVQCPYCGESIEIIVDCSIPIQSYVEDCEVCCRPINVSVQIDGNGLPEVMVMHENDV